VSKGSEDAFRKGEGMKGGRWLLDPFHLSFENTNWACGSWTPLRAHHTGRGARARGDASRSRAARRRREVRSDLLELLQRDSQGVRAFEPQSAVGGGSHDHVSSSLPIRKQNERLIDDLAASLEKVKSEGGAMRPRHARGPPVRAAMISYTEANTSDVRACYDPNKWLYATSRARAADDDLDHASRSEADGRDDPRR